MEESRRDSNIVKAVCVLFCSPLLAQYPVRGFDLVHLESFYRFLLKTVSRQVLVYSAALFLRWRISRNCICNLLEGAQVHWLLTRKFRAHSLGKSTVYRFKLEVGIPSENGMFKFCNPNLIRLPMKSLKIGHITVFVHDVLTVLLLIYEKRNFTKQTEGSKCCRWSLPSFQMWFTRTINAVQFNFPQLAGLPQCIFSCWLVGWFLKEMCVLIWFHLWCSWD